MITKSQDILFTFQNVCKQNTFSLVQSRRAYNFKWGQYTFSNMESTILNNSINSTKIYLYGQDYNIESCMK